MRDWTPEQRQRQADLIKLWRPWRHSSGPKSVGGKRRSSSNSLKHGLCSAKQKQIRKQERQNFKAVEHILDMAEGRVRPRHSKSFNGIFEAIHTLEEADAIAKRGRRIVFKVKDGRLIRHIPNG